MNIKPKRRRCKDNQYELIIEENNYKVKFIDSHMQLQIITIGKLCYDLLNQFELNDLKWLNEYDRHIEHCTLYESTLYAKSMQKSMSVESIVEQHILNESLYIALNKLPYTQRKRIVMYYFYGYSLKEISIIENCTIQAIDKSIQRGKIKLKVFLKNNYTVKV